MNSKEFYETTPVEFYCAMQDFADRVTRDYQTYYEIARFVALQVWNSAGKTLKRPIKKVQELVQFPWEKKEKQSIEEMKEQLLSIAKVFGSKKDSIEYRSKQGLATPNKRSDGS